MPKQQPSLPVSHVSEVSQLKVEQVSLTLPRAHQLLLKEISFSVDWGERIAVVGPSGAGKSTLFRILNRLSDPTQGNVYFRGQNIRQMPVLQLRQQVCLVLQESKLLNRTVQEALAYPLQLRHFPRLRIQQRLTDWVDRLRIPSEWLERTEVQLSVGQRQWVAIARALLTQPQILLLDEPTSALDGGRSQLLLEVLAELSQQRVMSILMINHQWNLVQQFCTRILCLQQGELSLDASAATLDWVQLQQQVSAWEAQEAADWD